MFQLEMNKVFSTLIFLFSPRLGPRMRLPPFQCAVGSGGRAGVDVELVLVLERLELVRVSRDEDVDVELPLQQRQAGHIAPGDHLVAVDEADLKLAHCDHLLLWIVQVLERKQ